jgi:hypothetical protein
MIFGRCDNKTATNDWVPPNRKTAAGCKLAKPSVGMGLLAGMKA